VRVVSEQQLLDELTNANANQASEDDSEDLLHIEYTLVALRLLQGGELTQDGGSTAQVVDSIDGVYQDAERGIALVDRGKAKNSVDADAVLVHEFVHAIQDNEQGLHDWRQQYPDYVDTSFALRTVSEGQATYAQFRAYTAISGNDVARVDWQRTFDKFQSELMTTALQDSSPYLAAITTFPYAYGAGLAHEFWSDHGAQFASPPQTTWQVLTHSAGDAFDAPITLEPVEPTPAADYGLVDNTVLGALLLELSTHQLGLSADQALDLAMAWRGDHLFIYAGPGPEQQTAWMWQLELRDAAHAKALQTLAVSAGLGAHTLGARAYFVGGDAEETPGFLLEAGAAFLATP
jgi:hypothetical protein